MGGGGGGGGGGSAANLSFSKSVYIAQFFSNSH